MNKTSLKFYFTTSLFLITFHRFSLADLFALSMTLTAYYKHGFWPALVALSVGTILSSLAEQYCKMEEPK